MSAHQEEEEVISSPLSSPRSSIFALDDFDTTPLKRAPGPALTDNLPPFHPQPESAAQPEPRSRTSSGRSLPNVLKDRTMPGKEGDEEQIAETITAYIHNTACDHGHAEEASTTDNVQRVPTVDNSQDTPADDNRQVTPPAEKRPATPESPDPIAVDTSKNGRKRKAPEPSSRTKKKVVLKKARKNDAKKWQAPAVFTDAKSPLVTAPLRAILLHPQAWDVLSPNDQAELRTMLSHDRPASLSQSPSPPGSGPQIDHSPERTRPNLDYLRSDDSFRFDCARYAENIEAGCHDPDWLAESWTAHERRKRGDFKEYLASKLERDWDVELPAKDGRDVEEGEKDSGDATGTAAVGLGEQKDDAALGESPVASSVGETRFTDMKLEVSPADDKHRAGEVEDGGADA